MPIQSIVKQNDLSDLLKGKPLTKKKKHFTANPTGQEQQRNSQYTLRSVRIVEVHRNHIIFLAIKAGRV